jgi:hypothetical protein
VSIFIQDLCRRNFHTKEKQSPVNIPKFITDPRFFKDGRRQASIRFADRAILLKRRLTLAALFANKSDQFYESEQRPVSGPSGIAHRSLPAYHGPGFLEKGNS